MESVNLRDRLEGCLVGGAAGDALGYAIEFWAEDEIFGHFGARGISSLAQAAEGDVAHFSDDTQMTLFTANGLSYGAQTRETGLPTSADIWLAYREWLGTQYDESRMDDPARPRMWVYGCDSLHALRAPGNTCLSAIRTSPDGGTPEQPVNHSKGCGGVMRVAPIGLFAASHPGIDAVRLGAEAAALTHGHPLGWLPAAVMAELVRLCCLCPAAEDPQAALRELLAQAMDATCRAFGDLPETAQLRGLLSQATDLADQTGGGPREDLRAIHLLGEGWVGDEALAIAAYAALAHAKSFADALVCAVNHRGDSDSTGAVCGNILGALLGRRAVEQAFDLSLLEERELLTRVAGSLA